jgi:hypothetical protein
MEPSVLSPLTSVLTHHVHVRTGWRVRDLAIELQPERAVLSGRARTSFTRRLVQQVVQEFLPGVALENGIVAEDPVEVLMGLPLC